VLYVQMIVFTGYFESLYIYIKLSYLVSLGFGLVAGYEYVEMS
jgi:hypothetical protein